MTDSRFHVAHCNLGDGDKIEKRGRGRPKKAKADCGIPAEGIEAGEDSPVDLDTAV